MPHERPGRFSRTEGRHTASEAALRSSHHFYFGTRRADSYHFPRRYYPSHFDRLIRRAALLRTQDIARELVSLSYTLNADLLLRPAELLRRATIWCR